MDWACRSSVLHIGTVEKNPMKLHMDAHVGNDVYEQISTCSISGLVEVTMGGVEM